VGNLIHQVGERARAAGVPLSVHLDLTWRCNERCIHCYLDHDDAAELSLDEIRALLDQCAAAGVFFLTLSGGEIFLRRDLREIVAHARLRGFDIKLKSNAILITERDVAWIKEYGVHHVQISIYSHRAEIHDAITKVPGSLTRSVAAIRMLRDRGIHVAIACVLMRPNFKDFSGVRTLAAELGAEFTIDPTITPHLNGDRSILGLNVGREELASLFHDETLVGDADAFCAPPPAVDEDGLDGIPCGAGHTSCYISPHGDVYPCVQFPLACGNIRETPFENIWRQSDHFQEVRAIRARDLPTCSSCGHVGTCSRCPGLAYMEGSMYGPSTADCEKTFVRTGIPTENMRRRGTEWIRRSEPLVNITIAQTGLVSGFLMERN
jgi:radical SAM protein with 4Fe4S-binding SPASM domain